MCVASTPTSRETENNAALLPFEFRMLGIKPGRWTPAVVISRHQALASNAGEEVRSMRAIKAIGVDRTRELMYFQGGDPRFELDAAIDPTIFPDNVLEPLYGVPCRHPVQA